MIYHPYSMLSFFTVWLGAAVFSHLSLSDAIVIVGAIGFGIASLRSGRMKVLRDTNTDLKERNLQLENEKLSLSSRVATLEAQPNLDQHAKLLEGMLHTLEKHDERMTVLSGEILRACQEIRIAVVPPR